MKEYPQIFYPNTEIVNKVLINYENNFKGFTETFFEYKLQKYFKGYILKNVVLNDRKQYPYQPDYVFFYEEYNLFIDIEIDEPYAYKSRKPIHIDDDKRNKYFLDNGWSIIRFSEFQITKFPELCCKVISEHIRNLTGENIWMEGFHELEDLEFIKAWDFTEAQNMASKSHREDYLKLLQRVDEKKPEISIIADGIFLNQEISETKSILAEESSIDKFNESANISLLLKLLMQYADHFKVNNTFNNKIYVEFTIYISKYHSFYNFSFDTDFIEIGNYIINVYYIRTGGIICFEIFEKIESERIDNVMLIADDPAYPPFLTTFNKNNIILVRKYRDTFMPNDFKYINIENPIESSLEIIYKEDNI